MKIALLWPSDRETATATIEYLMTVQQEQEVVSTCSAYFGLNSVQLQRHGILYLKVHGKPKVRDDVKDAMPL